MDKPIHLQEPVVAIDMNRLLGTDKYYGGISFDVLHCGAPYTYLYPEMTNDTLVGPAYACSSCHPMMHTSAAKELAVLLFCAVEPHRYPDRRAEAGDEQDPWQGENTAGAKITTQHVMLHVRVKAHHQPSSWGVLCLHTHSSVELKSTAHV